jgi:hypothetical protein
MPWSRQRYSPTLADAGTRSALQQTGSYGNARHTRTDTSAIPTTASQFSSSIMPRETHFCLFWTVGYTTFGLAAAAFMFLE